MTILSEIFHCCRKLGFYSQETLIYSVMTINYGYQIFEYFFFQSKFCCCKPVLSARYKRYKKHNKTSKIIVCMKVQPVEPV